MYLHIGGDVMVPADQIVVIMNLEHENASVCYELIEKHLKNNHGLSIRDQGTKTMILLNHRIGYEKNNDPYDIKDTKKDENEILFSPISASTLQKRIRRITQ